MLAYAALSLYLPGFSIMKGKGVQSAWVWPILSQ